MKQLHKHARHAFGFVVVSLCAQATWSDAPYLALQDALEMGKTQSVDMRIQTSQQHLSALAVDNAQAGLWPTLDLTSDISRPGPNLRGDPWLNNASRTQYETAWRTNLALQWVVFDGLGNWANVDLARKNEAASSAKSAAVTLQLRTQIAASYWEVSRAQALCALYAENLSHSQELLRIADAKHKLGANSLLDVRQAELDRNADSSATLKQNLALMQAERVLNSILERDLETSFTVDSLAILDSTLNLETLHAALLKSQPQLRAAQLAEQASDANVRIAGSDWFPAVSVYAKYQFLEEYSATAPPPDEHSQGLLWGAQLSLPLFEGGRTRAKIASAKESRELARYTTQQVTVNLEKALALSWASYQQSIQLWQMELHNSELANATYKLALEQYQLGAISAIEMRRLQESNTQAASRAAMARFDAKQGELTLLTLSGVMD